MHGLCPDSYRLIISEFQGDRLSHAVGCAFAICLEKKQKRDQECAVTMSFDNSNSSFTRIGSFRQATITERLADPQVMASLNKYMTSSKNPEFPLFRVSNRHWSLLQSQAKMTNPKIRLP